MTAENVSWPGTVSETTRQRLVGSKWKMRRCKTLQKQWRKSPFPTHHKHKKGKIGNLSIHKLWYSPLSFCMHTIQNTLAQSLSLHFIQYLQQMFYKSYSGWLGKWVQPARGDRTQMQMTMPKYDPPFLDQNIFKEGRPRPCLKGTAHCRDTGGNNRNKHTLEIERYKRLMMQGT